MILTLLFFLLSVSFTQAATQPRYSNPYQGLFQCHATNVMGSDFVKGGSMVVSWGFLQNGTQTGLNQTNLNLLITELRRIKSMGKKVYLHFMVYGHEAEDPPDVVSYKRPHFPDWLSINYSNTSDNDNDNRIKGLDGGGPSLYPSPWDREYKIKLERVLTLFNQALHDNNVADAIEYIEPSVGGRWAAPELWIPADTLQGWRRAAGCPENDWNCLGREFTRVVNEITGIYMRSLPEYPFMFVGGSCRSPISSQSCNYTGFNDLKNTYGMRVFYKKAGLGHITMANCGVDPADFWGKCNGSRCGQETWGTSLSCTGDTGQGFQTLQDGVTGVQCNAGDYRGLGYWGVYEKLYDDSLKREGLSYYCMYREELVCGREPRVGQVNQTVANRLGAQISLTSHTLSSTPYTVNSTVPFTISWRNTGSVPPISPLKQCLKWLPSSYKLFLEFVKDGRVVHYQTLDLTPPTTEWTPRANSTPKSISVIDVTTPLTFTVSPSLGGASPSSQTSYRLFVGLVDPNGDNQRFALINNDSNNDPANRRYLLADNFIVTGQQSSVTPIPTSTPYPCSFTPAPTVPQPTTDPNVTPTPTPASQTPAPTSSVSDLDCTSLCFSRSTSCQNNCSLAGYSCHTLSGSALARQPICAGTPDGQTRYLCCRPVSPTPTTPPASCSCSSGLPKNQGNSNCDSRIDLADFIIWKTAFIAGQSASSSDYNCDQRTDLLDFTIWKNHFQ